MGLKSFLKKYYLNFNAVNFHDEIDFAWNNIKAFCKENKLEAFSLFKGRIGDSTLGIDVYGDFIFVFLFEVREVEELPFVVKALNQVFPGKEVIFKNKLKDKSEIVDNSIFEVKRKERFIVGENGAKFLIDPFTYMDTGLFLDHRPSRKWVRDNSKGKKVANLFAYTGSFSVFAGIGGAELTHTVDLSKVYLAWARDNLDLNGLQKEKHWTLNMDSFEYLKYAEKKNLKFDIVVIDPPTFSKNGKLNFSVQRDHYDLVDGAMKILNEDGMVIFSNNYRNFELDYRIRNQFDAEEKTEFSIDLDFDLNRQELPHRSFWIRFK